MSHLAIRAEGLGKRYRISPQRQRQLRLGARVGETVGAPFRYLLSTLREPTEDESFWALREVGFEIPPGEVVGLVGHNGAGKSTLLKLLTRITEPTTGWAEIRGRVGSLLEVGTGFHPELTGRENIFLNGSILGMRRREIQARLDQIVEFAEVDRFIDTPVKRYSSGMYVRLAFSVAAHLEPDVLIVDEVLAVGDAAFQRKCMEKMEEVTGRGRTILFVSHNMAAVNRLCTTAILMNNGRLMEQGSVRDITSRYLALDAPAGSNWRRPQEDRAAAGDFQVLGARVLDSMGLESDILPINQVIQVEVDYVCHQPTRDLHVQVQILNESGEVLFAAADHVEKERLGFTHAAGAFRSTCEIPGNLLAEGPHTVSVVLIDLVRRRKQEAHRRILAFWVTDPADGTTARGGSAGDWPGFVRPVLGWRVQSLDDRPEEVRPGSDRALGSIA